MADLDFLSLQQHLQVSMLVLLPLSLHLLQRLLSSLLLFSVQPLQVPPAAPSAAEVLQLVGTSSRKAQVNVKGPTVRGA